MLAKHCLQVREILDENEGARIAAPIAGYLILFLLDHATL